MLFCKPFSSKNSVLRGADWFSPTRANLLHQPVNKEAAIAQN
jgi:hypothetical protein